MMGGTCCGLRCILKRGGDGGDRAGVGILKHGNLCSSANFFQRRSAPPDRTCCDPYKKLIGPNADDIMINIMINVTKH